MPENRPRKCICEICHCGNHNYDHNAARQRAPFTYGNIDEYENSYVVCHDSGKQDIFPAPPEDLFVCEPLPPIYRPPKPAQFPPLTLLQKETEYSANYDEKPLNPAKSAKRYDSFLVSPPVCLTTSYRISYKPLGLPQLYEYRGGKIRIPNIWAGTAEVKDDPHSREYYKPYQHSVRPKTVTPPHRRVKDYPLTECEKRQRSAQPLPPFRSTQDDTCHPRSVTKTDYVPHRNYPPASSYKPRQKALQTEDQFNASSLYRTDYQQKQGGDPCPERPEKKIYQSLIKPKKKPTEYEQFCRFPPKLRFPKEGRSIRPFAVLGDDPQYIYNTTMRQSYREPPYTKRPPDYNPRGKWQPPTIGFPSKSVFRADFQGDWTPPAKRCFIDQESDFQKRFKGLPMVMLTEYKENYRDFQPPQSDGSKRYYSSPTEEVIMRRKCSCCPPLKALPGRPRLPKPHREEEEFDDKIEATEEYLYDTGDPPTRYYEANPIFGFADETEEATDLVS